MKELDKLSKLVAATKNLPKAQADQQAWLDSTAPARLALERECKEVQAEVQAASARYKAEGKPMPQEEIKAFGARAVALAKRKAAFEQEQMDLDFRLQMKYGLVDGHEYTDAEIDQMLTDELTPEEFNTLVLDGEMPKSKKRRA